MKIIQKHKIITNLLVTAKMSRISCRPVVGKQRCKKQQSVMINSNTGLIMHVIG